MKPVYFSVTSNEIPNPSAAVIRFSREVAPLKVAARNLWRADPQTVDELRDVYQNFIPNPASR